MAVLREMKEGKLIGYDDPDTAIIKPGDGGDNIIIYHPGIQLLHPNPPLNIYYLQVTIDNGGQKIVIQRDIQRR